TITDPNIAYLLMSIGFIGIIAELYSPGLIFPGVIGVLSLLVGFTAIGSLPIGWAGLALLVLGILLLVFEAQAPGFGIFGIAGIVAFALGSLMLYTPVTTPSPALPQVKVSPWLIAAITAGFGAFVWVVFRAAVIPMRHPSPVGGAALIGSVGIALTELAPDGFVRIDSEEWSASLLPEGATDVIPAGAKVEVVAVDGVILKVRKAQKGS
ncbi:MAG TPA: serine protease, partial [Bdellovibrionales bacterium]|nr:serine protease [Bdellovibrionales bacterium]